VKGSRTSNASSQITSLFSKLSASSAAQNLIGQNSAAGLNGQGSSANNSSLLTTFGGQVVEVLPNGMLVVEAARQVEFSQQTQTIVLRGLVRPEDISQQNQVLSTAISSLELQVRGKGIVTDYTRRPNVLVRLLQKAVIF
jgi:flagellar L-ring protein precursor FlgH